MKPSLSTLSVVVLILASVSCDSTIDNPSPESFRPTGYPIRVQVVDDGSDPFEVSCDGPIRVYEIPNGHAERLIGEFSAGAIRIQPGERGTVIGGESEPFPNRCRLVAEPGHHFLVRPDLRKPNRYRYRGVLDVFNHSGVLRLINDLSVEEYLLGVVGREMRGKEFSLEALKAQAIAARTFTLYHLRAKGPQPLDRPFPASTDFQSYLGVGFETDLVVRAVRETRGQILTFGGKLFQSYYHSTCGGKTANGAVFNEREIEPLEGVDCGFCDGASTYDWQVKIDAAKLGAQLQRWTAERDIRFGRIVGLEPVERDPSGHSTYVRVHHSKGNFELRSDRLRALVAASGQRLPSSRFEARLDPRAGELNLVGHGLGHGVGLCQRGAGVMSKDQKCGDILARYFPGSGLRSIY